LGANAAPLAFPLLRAALSAGEFDAQENAISTVESAKLYEVQKCLCLTGHIYDALGFIVSADLLEDLTEAQQAALTACARKGAAVSREACDAANRDGIGRLRVLGMTVIDDVDVAAFRAASKPFLRGLAATYGADRIDRLLAAVA
jgi:TRAP-type C4-dicarboxylate transport system substrate-binding protein